jgi:NAD(P)-dependent dehydrogenase (short-subunit alcohol dehydrogenase family)
MVERGWGRIINILSIAGKRAGKFNSAYSTAKHAGLGLTRALATEFGQTNVTINAICPGWFHTDLTERNIKNRSELFGLPASKIHDMFLQEVPQRVVMEPEEIVPLTVFLAYAGAQRITGQAINICGGAVMF